MTYIIKIVNKGITSIPADCIVNAANNGLWEGGGVCGAIFQAAGSAELTKACKKIGHCDTGSAVITPAFKMDAKYIIHAVGPVYKDGEQGEPSQLYDCYKKSLELAKEYDCHSIVFPVISAGIFGYPKEAAWRKAIRACVNFLKKNPDYQFLIYFAVSDKHMLALGNQVLSKILAEVQGDGTTSVAADVKNGAVAVEKADTFSKKAGKKKDSESDPSSDEVKAARVKVFEDTMVWIQSDLYLLNAVKHSCEKTEIFWNDDYPVFDKSRVKDQKIVVTKNRSYQAAMRLSKENPGKKIAVMNFANARVPGGGVKKGAGAQEECLCRCSTLYPVISNYDVTGAFYKYHKKLIEKVGTDKASDTMMYSEDIVIVKTDEDMPERMDKADWVCVDIMTVAAPDLRKKKNPNAKVSEDGAFMNNAELFAYHVKRAIHMLTVAVSKGAEVLVLGAFGCGAFKNDPEVVARAYKVALEEFPKVFEKVEFAVYCGPEDETNYQVFKKVLDICGK